MGDEADRAWEEEEIYEESVTQKAWAPDISFPDYASGARCPYCSGPVHKTNATLVYGPDGAGFGKLWVCAFYPKCDAYVGSHPDGRPKGTLANPALRMARRLAHNAFDPTWRGKGKGARSRAYEKLSKRIHMPPHVCHIGLFDILTCQLVVQLYTPKTPTGKMSL